MYVRLKPEVKTVITADDVIAIELNDEELIEKNNCFSGLVWYQKTLLWRLRSNNLLLLPMKKFLKNAIMKSLMFHHQDIHNKLELLEESQEYIKKKLETIEKVLIKHYEDDMF